MPRPLMGTEIDGFAARKGVKRIAVENFLGTMDVEQTPMAAHLINLESDARDYRWSAATKAAIKAGIKLAYTGRSKA